MSCPHLIPTEILDSMFEASTLEEAISWRRIILERLKMVLTHAELSEDEVRLYMEATEVDLALCRLELALAADERLTWSPANSVPKWYPNN